jgi:hypothetical protein
MERLRPRTANTERLGVVRFATLAELDAPAADLSLRAVDAVRVQGTQSVAGVKTFLSIPLLPVVAPTDPAHAANKGYVDAFSSNADNLSSGTVAATRLPASTTSLAGIVTLQTAEAIRLKTGAGPFTPLAQVQALDWVVLAPAASHAPDLNLGINFEVQADTAAFTLNNPTNVTIGQQGIFLLRGVNIGGDTALSFGSNYTFVGGVRPRRLKTDELALVRYSAHKTDSILCSFIEPAPQYLVRAYDAEDLTAIDVIPFQRVLALTAGGTLGVRLPAAPSTGDWVQVSRRGANNVVILRNGELIEGAAADLTMDSDLSALELLFDGGSWRAVKLGELTNAV